jgi:peptide chain release factor 2
MRLVGLFDLEKLRDENRALELQMQEPGFWNDQEKAQKVSQKLKHNTNRIDEFNSLKQLVEDIELLVEMIKEEDDESQVPELIKTMDEAEDQLENASFHFQPWLKRLHPTILKPYQLLR